MTEVYDCFVGFPLIQRQFWTFLLNTPVAFSQNPFSKHQNSNNFCDILHLLSCHNAFRIHCNNCGLAGEELWVSFYILTAIVFCLLSGNYSMAM